MVFPALFQGEISYLRSELSKQQKLLEQQRRDTEMKLELKAQQESILFT
jgi:hypothetical protein